MKACAVIGCGRKHYGKGLCGLHYQRQWRNSSVTAEIPPRETNRHKKGAAIVRANGYVYRSGRNRNEHVLIAEKALGRPIPRGVVVHHIDENKRNNANSNLLICTREYHNMIHARMRALAEAGNASFRKCHICRTWSHPSGMQKNGRGYRHKECHRLYEINRRNKEK